MKMVIFHSYVNVYQRVQKIGAVSKLGYPLGDVFLRENGDKQWGLFSGVAYSDAPKW